jgi:hypothetical protein
MPAIGFEGHYPSNWSTTDIRPHLYVIPEKPGSPYRSARALVLRIHPSKPSIADIILLADLYPENTLPDRFYEKERVYYLTTIDKHGKYEGWAGPLEPTDPRMQAILSRRIDFSQAFQEEYLAQDMITFVQDMKFCFGDEHPVYQDTPYVIHWVSLSEALNRRKNPKSKERYPTGDLWLNDQGVHVWAPVMAAEGDTLGGYHGALSTGLDFANWRVESLYIDLN